MGTLVEVGREFWRGVLEVGGHTVVPRWTSDPVPGVGVHEVAIPGEVAAALDGLGGELQVPVDSMLLAAHAKVLAALSGEREVALGYVAAAGGESLPCRLRVTARSWRGLLLDVHESESELLVHSDFPVGDLKKELGLAGPAFETVFDPRAATGRGSGPAADGGHGACGSGSVGRLTGWVCGCTTEPMLWTPPVPPGSPGIT